MEELAHFGESLDTHVESGLFFESEDVEGIVISFVEVKNVGFEEKGAHLAERQGLLLVDLIDLVLALNLDGLDVFEGPDGFVGID